VTSSPALAREHQASGPERPSDAEAKEADLDVSVDPEGVGRAEARRSVFALIPHKRPLPEFFGECEHRCARHETSYVKIRRPPTAILKSESLLRRRRDLKYDADGLVAAIAGANGATTEWS
jgi:hypothetical protein